MIMMQYCVKLHISRFQKNRKQLHAAREVHKLHHWGSHLYSKIQDIAESLKMGHTVWAKWAYRDLDQCFLLAQSKVCEARKIFSYEPERYSCHWTKSDRIITGNDSVGLIFARSNCIVQPWLCGTLSFRGPNSFRSSGSRSRTR